MWKRFCQAMNNHPMSSAASATPRQTHRIERCALSLVIPVLAASPLGRCALSLVILVLAASPLGRCALSLVILVLAASPLGSLGSVMSARLSRCPPARRPGVLRALHPLGPPPP